MFKVNKSKGAIGVLSLLLLITLTPSAMAGKPGPTLDGKLCKRFGGTWDAGKNATCYLVNDAENTGEFTIKAGQELRIIGGRQFINIGTIYNSGTILNYGIFVNNNVVNNSGYITSICPGYWASILPMGTGEFNVPSC